MTAQVEVGTAVNTLYLLEPKRHQELDIGCGIGVVRQLIMVVEAVFLVTQAQCLMPFQAELFPVLEPFQLLTRTNEELHLHLLELAHTEDELTSDNLVAECLTNLRNSERNLHTARLLHVQEVHEDTLCGLRTKINLHCAVCRRTHLCREHQVELTYVGPVARAANRTNDLLIQDDLL